MVKWLFSMPSKRGFVSPLRVSFNPGAFRLVPRNAPFCERCERCRHHSICLEIFNTFGGSYFYENVGGICRYYYFKRVYPDVR